MDVNGEKLLINAANLRIDAVDVQDTTLAQPLVSALLLIKESAYERFFSTRELPSDTCAILSSIAYELNDDEDAYIYYYSFNLAKLVSTQYRDNLEDITDDFKMVLVPVTVEYDDDGYVTEVNQQNVMSTTKICSGTNPDNPMKLKVIYSGF